MAAVMPAAGELVQSAMIQHCRFDCFHALPFPAGRQIVQSVFQRMPRMARRRISPQPGRIAAEPFQVRNNQGE